MQLGTNGTVDPGRLRPDDGRSSPTGPEGGGAQRQGARARGRSRSTTPSRRRASRSTRTRCCSTGTAIAGEHPEFFWDDGIHLRPEGAARLRPADRGQPARRPGRRPCEAPSATGDRRPCAKLGGPMRTLARSLLTFVVTHRHRRHRRRRVPRRADPGHRRDRHRAPLHGRRRSRSCAASRSRRPSTGPTAYGDGRRSASRPASPITEHRRGPASGASTRSSPPRTDRSGPTTASTSARCSAPSSPTSRRASIEQGGSTITQQLVKNRHPHRPSAT